MEFNGVDGNGKDAAGLLYIALPEGRVIKSRLPFSS